MESVTKAIQYIESNITQELGVNDVSERVYASGSYFQRVFHIVTGMTIGDYIRNRRLTLAAQEILRGQSLIGTVMKYQYDTQESFSKAFTRFHGVTPSALRKSGSGAKAFHPLEINITIQGGFDMSRKVIPVIRPLISDMRGENYWFNGCAAYAMEALGETDYDYWFFAGITGDIFTQFYPRKDAADASILWKCAASDFRMGPAYAAWLFDQVGYACEYVTEQELLADRERYLRKLMDSIDRGIPVIHCAWGVFVGYEDGGKTLLYITHELTEAKRLTLGNDRLFDIPEPVGDEREIALAPFDWIFVGEKTREASLPQLYREAIQRLPEQLTAQTDDYIFGAEAFRAWADDIENGKYDDPAMLEGKTRWNNYENYVCVLATNGSCCFSFLEKAMELNPDMGWLKKIARLYKKMGRMWGGDKPSIGCLEKLGGGFNVKYETLRKPRKRAKIAAKIRAFADAGAASEPVARYTRSGSKSITTLSRASRSRVIFTPAAANISRLARNFGSPAYLSER